MCLEGTFQNVQTPACGTELKSKEVKLMTLRPTTSQLIRHDAFHRPLGRHPHDVDLVRRIKRASQRSAIGGPQSAIIRFLFFNKS